MKCPTCGGADLKHETRDVEYEYKGFKTIIRGITGDYCGTCGEAVLGDEAGDKYMAAITAFNRLVNAEEVDPAFIASVRKRLKLDQRQAAEIFGGGVNAFSRYETGRVAPPRSLVLLFKALEKHPEILEEIKYA
ncbi:YgiT-type zinc finger protein [Salmonella enterica]|uniref:type II TA system antitoxin MqsA family protein n=1 Tax=Salmonella enterica TaxID=28901 RepID=UPI0009AE6D88|nr:type II TA system antitoxin MqsA family protein [Salmonella enterica]EAA9733948.1 YgiT-type zinc finger protein [Salmonella enterica]EAM6395159.1 YgiT-type zinc finger protein [Salmonella enterica]EAN4591100.1 YgiT-type zinc finger protein [Salmonella enterica]EAS2825991.1 YgiT-type zinc finger protein [Salmonella enterica]EAU0359388.1 YgiT-type zinc finger protein [Salmonella enterica]